MNPWEHIPLEIYESHMKLDTVYQLQGMNEIMKSQMYTYDVESLVILGIAGGNGLNHVNTEKLKKVYGIDINSEYLMMCKNRYPHLQDNLMLLKKNMLDLSVELPKADLVVANLFLEYIGMETFQAQLKKMSPKFVSIVIQVNDTEGFVSESPYHNSFDCLEAVYQEVNSKGLTKVMNEAGFDLLLEVDKDLPNKKILRRQDYKKRKEAGAG
jgi:hypothetical protein